MSAASYSRSDRLLHQLALGSKTIAEMSFDLERSTQKPDGTAVQNGKHVFISGLARAGTTVLMRRFHSTGAFGSLTYRDMPFSLAPGLWLRLSGRSRQKGARGERAHGDGLEVDVDSPESLDEIFWRIFCGDQYLRDDALVPHSPEEEARENFRIYVAAILQSREGNITRYLSKTNNSILRLGSLREIFPKCLIIVPFRDPLQHAYSLKRQHARFKLEQRDDTFVGKYMRWLAHHEFGLDHRPFVFDGNRPQGDPANQRYWLELWVLTYNALLERHRGDVIFLSYDQLCQEPENIWGALAESANLPTQLSASETLVRAVRKVPPGAPQELVARAQALHADLKIASLGS